ncbi:MAG: HEAT repeat domain-containing protein [Persicimonas sp.]
MSTYTLGDILEHEWSKETIEQFVAHCYDRKALMSALIAYADEFLTHRLLVRVQSGGFRTFMLQGWPEHVDEAAKIPRLRKLQLPAATSERVSRGLTDGHQIAAPPAEFALQRVFDFLGEDVSDEELLCQPITVGGRTEWALIGKPIRIDPNSESFSSDSITLNFWELEEVCDSIGAQYQSIRRLNKRDKLPPKPERVPSLESLSSGADEAIEDEEFEPVEVNKRTQKRANADANSFSAERFLAGEDAFGGARKPSPMETALGSDVSQNEEREGVGVTTGMVDARSMAEVNYGESLTDDDEAPALEDIENTAGIQLDESVLDNAKQAYQQAVAREKREEREKRERESSKRHSTANRDRPITAKQKGRIKKAIALMDGKDREKAFRAADYVAGFGERAVKTLGRLFPGRLLVDRFQFQVDNMPPVEKHSPVLHALVELGEPALKVSRHYLDNSSNDLRFYATYLYTRLPAEGDLEHIVERLFDRDRQTRALAQRIVADLREAQSFEYLVLQPLRHELDLDADDLRQAVAIETLGRCRDVGAIDKLIKILKFKEGRPALLAHQALRRIGLQDLPASAVTWEQWWQNQRPDYADQWLVGALDSDSKEIRRIALEEVERLDDIDIDYRPDYPRGRRRTAQQDLAVWLGVKEEI